MKEKTICRGDLFYYDFGTRTGSVQSGTRPVLVIQADDYNRNAQTIIVAAVTGVIKKRYLPSHILLGQEFGLKKPSMVLLEQLQTVIKDELRDYLGTIEDEQLLRRINITLKKTFGLWIYKEEKKENIRCLCQMLCVAFCLSVIGECFFDGICDMDQRRHILFGYFFRLFSGNISKSEGNQVHDSKLDGIGFCAGNSNFRTGMSI